MTETGAMRGAVHQGPDQARGVREVVGILFAHNGRWDNKAVETVSS